MLGMLGLTYIFYSSGLSIGVGAVMCIIAVVLIVEGIDLPQKPSTGGKCWLIGNKTPEMQPQVRALAPGQVLRFDWDPTLKQFYAASATGVVGYFPADANKYLEKSPTVTVDSMGLDDQGCTTVKVSVQLPKK